MPEKRATLVTIDLLDRKEPWLAWCRSQGTTPSTAFRQIVDRLTGGGSGLDPSVTKPSSRTYRSASPGELGARRLTLRLTASELRAAEERADATGFSPSRWVVALVRAQLTREPQIGEDELTALLESNSALRAIGRNLNQIAKALNISVHERLRFKVDLIESVDQAVKVHTEHVSRLLAANAERWRLE